MGDCTPSQFLERCKRSRRECLGIGALGLTNKEYENKMAFENKGYINLSKDKKKLVRARAFSKDLKRWVI